MAVRGGGTEITQRPTEKLNDCSGPSVAYNTKGRRVRSYRRSNHPKLKFHKIPRVSDICIVLSTTNLTHKTHKTGLHIQICSQDCAQSSFQWFKLLNRKVMLSIEFFPPSSKEQFEIFPLSSKRGAGQTKCSATRPVIILQTLGASIVMCSRNVCNLDFTGRHIKLVARQSSHHQSTPH